MIDCTIPVTCGMCCATKEIGVNKSDYEKWTRREGVIQELLHYLPADEREMLISGTCDGCFKSMFDEDEEDYEDEDGED